MFMSYGEFQKLTQLEHSTELFVFWLRSHLLPPSLLRQVCEKLRKNQK